MKVYIAAKYQDRAAAKDLGEFLKLFGIEVTSRWCNSWGASPKSERMLAEDAKRDIEDIEKADFFILLPRLSTHYDASGPQDSNESCGRHVEMGYALAMGKRIIVVGEKNNVFHWLPEVTNLLGPKLKPCHIVTDGDGHAMLSQSAKITIYSEIKP